MVKMLWYKKYVLLRKRLLSLYRKTFFLHPTRLDVLQKIIKKVHAKTYLEIGIDKGNVFENIHCDIKIGIDPCTPYKVVFQKNEKYYQIKSDNFFANSESISILEDRGIDVAFIDGLHEYSQVLRDVNNCLKYLNQGGYIVVHDCNPDKEMYSLRAFSYDEAKQTAERLGFEWIGPWMGDVWKAIIQLRTREDLHVCVLDCDSGLGIVTKSHNNFSGENDDVDIEKLTYSFLDKNRTEILNLKPPKYIHRFLHLTKK